jgi:ribonuclease HII
MENEYLIYDINILQATQRSMHTSILETRKQLINKMKENNISDYNFHLLIDGNYFNPITILNKNTNKIENIPYNMIEGGDNKYSAIAAASILAKVYRDKYIEELCQQNPHLSENYGIDSNKGYGAKKHIEGIKQHGITIWHRRTFGICKNYA